MNTISRKRPFPGRKNVQFSSQHAVFAVPNRKDQPEEQIWYSDKDYRNFKDDAKNVTLVTKAQVEYMIATNTPLSTTCVPRGIEQRVCSEYNKRKYISIRALLDSQKKLHKEMVQRRVQQLVRAGYVTPETAATADPKAILKLVPPSAQEIADSECRLAKISNKFTAWSTSKAIATGISDAQEASRLQLEDDNFLSSIDDDESSFTSTKRVLESDSESEEDDDDSIRIAKRRRTCSAPWTALTVAN